MNDHPPLNSSQSFSRQAPGISSLYGLGVLLIFAAALLLRLAYWQDAKGYALRGDEPDYVLPAQTLVREGQYVDTFIVPGRTWTRVPLTSLTFALSYLFVPDPGAARAVGDNAALMEPRYAAANFLQIGLGLVTVGLIMGLAWKSFPARRRRASLVAGGIGALYPPLASSSAQHALSETTAIMLLYLGMYALSRWTPEMPRSRAFSIMCGAGGILGLAALARPAALAFLPFACLWLFLGYREHRARTTTKHESRLRHAGVSIVRWLKEYRRPIVGGVVATAACLLTIMPWTLYNQRQYGRFLLLDTASINAIWDFHNYRHDDIPRLTWALPNPADRQALSLKQAAANIQEYPGQALRSAIFALGYIWHLELNSAVEKNPWDMTQRDPDVPDLVPTDAAFLLVSLAGMAGLAAVALRRPGGEAGRTLLLIELWLLSSLLMGIVIPTEARYRLPSAPAIIVMAAGLFVLADWRWVFSRRAWDIVRSNLAVALLAGLLCTWVIVGAYSRGVLPLARSLFLTWRADATHTLTNIAQSYRASEEAVPGSYLPYRHAADAIRLGGRSEQDDAARELYARSRTLNPDDPYGLLGFADLAYRHVRDWKLTQEESDWLAQDEIAWRGNPWNSFRPSATTRVDVGDGREAGYILGFYGVEDAGAGLNYRWSRGRATVRIPAPSGSSFGAVTLNMSAPALGEARPMDVEVSVDGGEPTRLTVLVGWADYSLPLRPHAEGSATVTLEITSPTLSPAQLQPGSNDTRNLGIGVSSVKLTQPSQ